MHEELNALVPPTRRKPDWLDVLARAQQPLWRRPLVVAIAAALTGLATAAAVTAALGGFDAWLSGEPGKPAPGAEQSRFAAANGRSWAAFPTSTKLRELIDTTIDGKRYVLFGFKSGQTLCLKLKAVSLGHSTVARCAPLSVVSRISGPIVLVDGADGFADRYNHPSAQFSFGIVADGVSRVAVRALDGMHTAVVRNNAYLWVENEPNTGNQITGVTAAIGNVRTTVAPTNYVRRAPVARPLRGPTRVQRRIAHPHIAWYDRGERRGHRVGKAQLIKPDELSNLVVGLQGRRRYCLITSFGSTETGARTCSPRKAFFARAPFNVITYSEGGEFTALAGAAADGVTRMTVFLSDGQTVRLPLKDNLFAGLVPWNGLPARVVAYAAGHVVGIDTVPGFFWAVPRRATHTLTTRLKIRAPYGAVGTLRIGPVIEQARCRRFDSTPISCAGINTGPWAVPEVALPVGRDVFVVGSYRAPVTHVELRFPNGDVAKAHVVDNVFVVAIPKSQLGTSRRQAMVFGLDGAGHVVQRNGVVYRANR